MTSVCEEAGVLRITVTKWFQLYGEAPPSPPKGHMKWTAEAMLIHC
jgi:hypothetical protein